MLQLELSTGSGVYHTSDSLAAAHAALQALQPLRVRLRLLEGDGVALLEDLVHGDERLECLHLVGEDGLPEWSAAVSSGAPGWVARPTHTFMPDQNDCELLWSHV